MRKVIIGVIISLSSLLISSGGIFDHCVKPNPSEADADDCGDLCDENCYKYTFTSTIIGSCGGVGVTCDDTQEHTALAKTATAPCSPDLSEAICDCGSFGSPGAEESVTIKGCV